jgi:hypothetical protein
MNDKNNRPLVSGAPVTVKLGTLTITGKVTGLDHEQNRVSVRDDHRGKGSRGEFSIEAQAVEIASKATKRSKSKLP